MKKQNPNVVYKRYTLNRKANWKQTENYIPSKLTQKAGVPILISDKVVFKIRLPRDRETFHNDKRTNKYWRQQL